MRVLGLGCGVIKTPKAGWDYLDARPLPYVTFVQSAVDLSNIPSDTYDLLVSNDMIEHLGWREVPDALGEWLRILKLGGRLQIGTPHADELLRILQGGEGTYTRNGYESEFQWFSRVAYGHQDYPENTHRCYLRPEWLEELLVDAGFRSVVLVSDEGHHFTMEGTR